ncbi:hypothetical protein BKK51_04235 [Rodentibacter trehalosifermentans]|uniref:Cell division protein FtsZ C-terminal domain-containing protein n=2 Tax=Rodentibacter trehalosifermentans TaxID=1908263 RepID=A0A1V3IVC2_9PAST|nr:hypothetical protein [Rodentibacter trehalosifermentans]OOF46068.1 hypothetical protein BKK51_04235 [Rodentibacter trehalosifermentans]
MFNEQTYAKKNAAIIVIGDLESSFKKLNNIILDNIDIFYLSEKEIFSFKINRKVIFIVADFYKLSISSRYFLFKNNSWRMYQVFHLFTGKKLYNFYECKMIYSYHFINNMNIYLIHHNIRAMISCISDSNEIHIDIEDFKMLFSGCKPMFAFAIGIENNGISKVSSAINSILPVIKDIDESDFILVNVTGWGDLLINEVNSIQDFILKEVKEDATVVFGFGKNKHLNDVLFLDVWYGKLI